MDAMIVPMVIILVVLLGCSAFFSGSETALMAVTRLQLRQLKKGHPRQVLIVEKLLKKPEDLISTILLGNNLVNVAMSALATALAISVWGETGIAYVTAGLTVLILIFAEITPKVYARYHNERIALLVGPVLKAVMTLLRPFVAAVSWVAGKLLRLAGIDITKAHRNIVTEAEVKALITISREDGGITADEKSILSRVFTLDDKTVTDIMVPQVKMVTLDDDDTIDHALRVIRRTGFSRYPVLAARDGRVVGFLHAKDLLGKTGPRPLRSLRGVVRPPVLVPADRKIDSQLRSFKRRRVHQALVVDENDAITGLVTLEDILEEMVGSIEDEYDVLEPDPAG